MPSKAKRQTKHKANIEDKEMKDSDLADITPTITPTSKPATKRTCITTGKSLKNLIVSSSLSVRPSAILNGTSQKPIAFAKQRTPAEHHNHQPVKPGSSQVSAFLPLIERLVGNKFWPAFYDRLSGSALTMAANKDEYKINRQSFLLQLNFIVQGISKDEAELMFYVLEFNFIKRPEAKVVKARCFSAFLREVEYVNRIMQVRIEYYATKWARLPAGEKYRTALWASKKVSLELQL